MYKRIFFCSLIPILYLSCNNKPDSALYEQYIDQFEELLSKKYLTGLEDGKSYELTKIVKANDPIYQTLIKKNIINKTSYIAYSSKDCITLVTRVRDNNLFHTFTDILITKNVRLGQFICGINDIYLLNQDEYVVRIRTYSESLTIELTLTTVEN